MGQVHQRQAKKSKEMQVGRGEGAGRLPMTGHRNRLLRGDDWLVCDTSSTWLQRATNKSKKS